MCQCVLGVALCVLRPCVLGARVCVICLLLNLCLGAYYQKSRLMSVVRRLWLGGGTLLVR